MDEARQRAARLLTASRSAMPFVDALQNIAARRAQLLTPGTPAHSGAEPDFSPAQLPVVDAPDVFAQTFWRKRSPSTQRDGAPPAAKPAKNPGRRPTGLRPEHDRFRIIDGDGVDNPQPE